MLILPCAPSNSMCLLIFCNYVCSHVFRHFLENAFHTHLQALSSKPIGFLRIVGLLFYYIKSGFATTARARARLWQDQHMSFGSEVPDHTMTILLGLAFSVVEPLIAPIALLYFLVMLLVGKYQMMYVFTEKFQSGGKAGHSALPCNANVACSVWLACWQSQARPKLPLQ